VTITPNAEQLITDVARASNPANQGKDGARLIRFLIDNEHWSPFEHAYVTFEVYTSRAISQQMIRHRSFTWQEWSQRYAEAPGIEPVQLRKQAEKNRQSSTDEILDRWPIAVAENALAVAVAAYQELIKAGVARECARMVLPLTTLTRVYMTGSVRSFIHYLALRTTDHTQLEHREIALTIRNLLKPLLPNVAEALEWE